MKLKNSFHPFAFTTITFWAMSYPVTRLITPYFASDTLAALRYMISALSLLLVGAFLKMKPPQKKHWPLVLCTGFVSFFLYPVFFNIGCAAVPSATSSVIIALSPIITAILAFLLFREKLRGFQWFSIGIQFVGVAVLTIWSSGVTVNDGMAWLLSAAFLLASGNLLQRKLTKTYSAFETTTYGIVVGAILLSIYLPEGVPQMLAAPLWVNLLLLFLAFCSSTIAYCFWAVAFIKAPNLSSVTNYMFVVPFLASIFGYITMGETLSANTIVGAGIIMVGLFIFNFGHIFLDKKRENAVKS